MRPFLLSPRTLPTLGLGLLLASVALPPIHAQNTPAGTEATRLSTIPNPDELIGPIILRDDSLSQVLDLLERWTGRTILRPQSLPQAQFTINLPRAVTKAEAILALETLLNMNQIAVTPLGDKFFKVVPIGTARSEAPQLIEGTTLHLPPSGKVASKLFQLQHLNVAEFMPLIQNGILSPNIGAMPVIFDKANAALITDSISNLQRTELLIEEIDRSHLTPKTYTIQFAKASELAQKIQTVIGGPLQSQFGANTSVNADDRTNKLIIVSDPRRHAFFDDLITQLDVRADPNTRNDVIFLKNANAPEVATLLSQLVSGQNTAARTAGSETTGGRRLTRQPGATSERGGEAPPTPQNTAAAVVSQAAASETFSSLLTILADERSNAIVVSGTSDDITLVRNLVEKIDILLAQVRIEVVIAEVSLGNEATSGIDELGLRIEDNKLTGFTAGGPGFSIGGLGTGTGGAGFADVSPSLDNLTAAIGLSTTPRKTNTTILSVPTIVTSHNKEAEIFVGETRPVISGTTSSASGSTTGLTTSSTVTQQEIGIRLRVIPLIGPSGSVQLEIEQEVADVAGNVTVDGNDQYIIGKRTTTSFVSVNNGDIIVLGGLQRTRKGKSTSRLGPIPIIGDLFGRRRREDTRTDLVFFLRPVVLTNTVLDNVEALERVDAGPQGPAIRAVIDRRPAAVTVPTPAAELPDDASYSPSTQRSSTRSAPTRPSDDDADESAEDENDTDAQ